MSASRKVTKPVGSVRTSLARASISPRMRTFCSWPVMKPTGTIPYFLAAFSSFVRARSRAASSSNVVWLKRDSALRTWAWSLIGRRRRPRESMYAKALLGNRARVFESRWVMAWSRHDPKNARKGGGETPLGPKPGAGRKRIQVRGVEINQVTRLALDDDFRYSTDARRHDWRLTSHCLQDHEAKRLVNRWANEHGGVRVKMDEVLA